MVAVLRQVLLKGGDEDFVAESVSGRVRGPRRKGGARESIISATLRNLSVPGSKLKMIMYSFVKA